jgi:hypothetical protein
MALTATRATLIVLLLTVSAATMLVARDRIFVDQWSPTRSELFIAEADGKNPRKLVAGLELDYNASAELRVGSKTHLGARFDQRVTEFDEDATYLGTSLQDELNRTVTAMHALVTNHLPGKNPETAVGRIQSRYTLQ